MPGRARRIARSNNWLLQRICRAATLLTAICVSVRFGTRCGETRGLIRSWLRLRRTRLRYERAPPQPLISGTARWANAFHLLIRRPILTLPHKLFVVDTSGKAPEHRSL